MATASNIKEGIQQKFLECAICLDSFKQPRCLPCLHASCSDCLKGWMNGKIKFPCPICKADTKVPHNGVQGFPVAFYVNALQDYIQNCGPEGPTIPCHNEKNQVAHDGATVKCLDCNVYYCRSCNNAHSLVAVAEHHETIPLSDLTQEHFQKASQKQVIFCLQHPTCPLNYYCQDTGCEIPVCQRCIMTRHKLHESVDLEEVSTRCRAESNILLQKDFLKSEQALGNRKKEVKQAIKNLNEKFDGNKEIIHDRYLKMKEELKQEEKKLIIHEEISKNKKIEEYQQQLIEIEQQVSSLGVTKVVIENMTNFSPDVVIVKQHKELQNKAARALEEMTPPDLWIHDTEVVSTVEHMYNMKLETKTQSRKTISCLNCAIDDIVLLDEFLVAWEWNTGDTPTDFFVSGKNARNARKLKQKLERICPQAYRMVSMRRDGNEVLVIAEGLKSAFNNIKMLNINDDKCETIKLKDSMDPLSLAVDTYNDIIFIDFATPRAIRKWTKGGVKTIFVDKDGNTILGNPWYVCMNINDDIIVSNPVNKSIIIFDAMGTVRKTYNNFTAGDSHNPYGVCTDKEGNIYVCDCNGHCIHCLDESGVFQEMVLTQNDGLWFPVSIKYSKGMLVVGQADGFVTYFKIQ